MATNYSYVDIVNAVNAQTGGMYAYEFPVVTSETFKAMSAALLNAPTQIQNAYIDNLRNLMCNLMIKQVYTATNPFRKLYRDATPMSADGNQYVTEIAIDQFIPQPYEKTPDANRFFESAPPQVKIQFLCNCLRKKYVVTINMDLLLPAFESEGQFANFFNKVMNRMQADMEEDDKEEIMAAIDGVIEGGNIYIIPMTRPVDSSTALNFSKELDIVSRDLSFKRHRGYNLQGLSTKTTEDSAVMIMAGDVIAVQNNFNLAWAFQRSYLDLFEKGQIIVTDSQGMADNRVFGMYVDKDWFRIHPAKGFPKLKKWENGDNLEEKYWMHSWKMVNFSYSSNALAFVEPGNIGVDSVELYTKDGQASATVKAGKYLMMGIAKVTPTTGKIADAFCRYTLEGAESEHTKIDPETGFLWVAKDETADTLTIKGTSHLDSSKTGTLTVTVTH